MAADAGLAGVKSDNNSSDAAEQRWRADAIAGSGSDWSMYLCWNSLKGMERQRRQNKSRTRCMLKDRELTQGAAGF